MPQTVIRRLILAGTKPSIGRDTVATEWPLVERFTYAMEPEAVEAVFAESSFTSIANGVAQAKAYWGRTHERAHDAVIMDAATTQAQLNDPWTHVSLSIRPRSRYLEMRLLMLTGCFLVGDSQSTKLI